jgi:hypothetical protein
MTDTCPLSALGANSLVSVMLADVSFLDAFGASWVQPMEVDNINTPGWQNGRHSAVQVWDPRRNVKTTYFYSDKFEGADPIPDPGFFEKYAAIMVWNEITNRYDMSVKLAGVGWYTFPIMFYPDSAQVFGEISNKAAQFPGEVSSKVAIKEAEWKNGLGSWSLIDDNSGSSGQPAEIGWGHPMPGKYQMWDKRCP